MDTNKPALPKPATDKALVNAPGGEAPASPAKAEEPTAPSTWLARNGLSLMLTILAVGGVVFLFKRYSDDPITDTKSLIKVAIGLSLVIFIHELGHFTAAKLCDVHVTTFSIGFFGSLFGFCRIKLGETTYKIGWLPLGGFVRMVGEGNESEEGEDDPRSYKNKPVWQRMIIISAGVFMNLVLAWVCYVAIYATTGVPRHPGVIGTVEPGGPAWEKGLRPGDRIRQIGSRQDPYYEDMQRVVQHSQRGEALPLIYERLVNGKMERIETQIIPQRDDQVLAPMILVTSSNLAVLDPDVKRALGLDRPCYPGSAADRATPALAPGDEVIAATDPDNPLQITPLREDPRWTDVKQYDYFDLHLRLQRLAGKPIVLRVKRGAETSPVDITVPPVFTRTLGLRMKMGPIAAVREDSPAAKAGVRPASGKESGDVLTAVEFTDAAGKRRRYSSTPGAGEEPLDPLRLPSQLATQAALQPQGIPVTLTVLRPEGHQGQVPVKLETTWQKGWELFDSDTMLATAPVSLAGLGLAYTVQPVIEDVEPNSPAAGSGLKPNDTVTRVEIRGSNGKKEKSVDYDTSKFQWGVLLSLLQDVPDAEVTLTTSDGQKVLLKPQEDATWPRFKRGFIFQSETRYQKADSISEVLLLSSQRLYNQITLIYGNLKSVGTGRVSVKSFAGPFTIFTLAFELAGKNTTEFILFLALISVNLAVVNFLPIPVLDGGHMMFLAYEGVRGKPPSETVRIVLTVLGFVFVIG
ncbi:MAG TPA: site-2 protease family protein, partial [Gemmataceae bacterium]|nr:site-2 protease family protein [Gemmataceae bacterium]